MPSISLMRISADSWELTNNVSRQGREGCEPGTNPLDSATRGHAYTRSGPALTLCDRNEGRALRITGPAIPLSFGR